MNRLLPQGFVIEAFPLPPSIVDLVVSEDWKAVDDAFKSLCTPGGELFDLLSSYGKFSTIETMISIRDAKNEYEEDGIWHDDGSRLFAFSLSLTPDAQSLEGGNLEIRRTNQADSILIPTPQFGNAIVFLTGVHGFEHRTRRVIRGRRIILVGWCS